MSLGHMTGTEQIVSLVGPIAAALAALYTAEVVDPRAGAGVFLGGFVAIFVIKVWCWRHTSYDDGLSNPRWVPDSEEATLSKQEDRGSQ